MLRQNFNKTSIIFLILTILLAACTLPGANGESTQDDPANQTAVAETIQANQTANAQPEATAEVTQDPGDDGGEDGNETGEDLEDDATFSSDVTIPDESYIEKGAKFTKTWRLMNSGDSTWTTGYRLIFESGERMGSPEFIPMPKEVKPGESVELSVEFTAPDTPGEYKSNWLFQNEKGKEFGVGNTGEGPIWVWIYSVEPNQGGNPGGISGGANVAAVTLGIDQAVYSGACPATFNISWNITTSDAGIVQHKLDLVPNTSGFTFDPVQTFTANYAGSGSTGFQYLLIISSSVDATARVNATGSNTVLSNLVGFSVNCQ